MAIRYLSKLGYVKALSFKLQSAEVSNVPEMSPPEIEEINYLTYNYNCVGICNIYLLSLFSFYTHTVQPAGKAMSRLPFTINLKYIMLISVVFVFGEVLLSRD